MKTIFTSVCALSLAFGTVSFAQDKGTAASQSKEVQQDTKTTTADRTAKTTSDTVYGKIESYDIGKSIKVTVPGKIINTKSFDLDDKNTTVDAASNLKVGEWVSVVEKTDSNGHKTVTIKPSSEKHATQDKTTHQ